MCPEGIRLYQAYVALLPQLVPEPNDAAIAAALATAAASRTPESEAARRAYESHCKRCRICHHSAIPGVQYAKKKGWNLDGI